ncbi:hypothetical protein BFW01_g3141 [Lasiodiplodia theobromae]|uniref:peptidylprolyl isomerase n=1 Tax=Lasiodiplodia theobromae TaxID=45133 RepID=A0A5N5DRP5_9PEZI|nr:Peptidyl-prolyl cis-trans isomerase [Lasiodiplodia theobromae]KAB2580300.1 FK506-binding protein 1B [Lasiodiplodia theobromae]KAF4541181.1 Peptidyl-prolyl cis-trans isomerase [Lasiodiplodia theobromae]KAF9632279.1 hypothetical protein BFW01_g3141 [Lasiodiplodia theobromae]
MTVTKHTLAPGNGVDRPRAGDDVTIEYTGYLFDANAPDTKGKKFDSSIGRGDFNVKIGIGRVIRGWDDGIIGAGGSEGMSLGEKATLTISSDYGYGANGFPGHIPPNADLVFDVELKAINGKRA